MAMEIYNDTISELKQLRLESDSLSIKIKDLITEEESFGKDILKLKNLLSGK